MKGEQVCKRVRNGKTYLSQVQNGGSVSIEIDESDFEMSRLADESIATCNIEGLVKYKRDMKKRYPLGR